MKQKHVICVCVFTVHVSHGGFFLFQNNTSHLKHADVLFPVWLPKRPDSLFFFSIRRSQHDKQSGIQRYEDTRTQFARTGTAFPEVRVGKWVGLLDLLPTVWRHLAFGNGFFLPPYRVLLYVTCTSLSTRECAVHRTFYNLQLTAKEFPVLLPKQFAVFFTELSMFYRSKKW